MRALPATANHDAKPLLPLPAVKEKIHTHTSISFPFPISLIHLLSQGNKKAGTSFLSESKIPAYGIFEISTENTFLIQYYFKKVSNMVGI